VITQLNVINKMVARKKGRYFEWKGRYFEWIFSHGILAQLANVMMQESSLTHWLWSLIYAIERPRFLLLHFIIFRNHHKFHFSIRVCHDLAHLRNMPSGFSDEVYLATSISSDGSAWKHDLGEIIDEFNSPANPIVCPCPKLLETIRKLYFTNCRVQLI